MSAPKKKGYRRSWKNLLLNKRYQLSFTLFMVGLSAILMTLLGTCVVDEARKATRVSENLVKVCSGDEIPRLQPSDDDSASFDPPADEPAPGGSLPGAESEGSDVAPDEGAPDGKSGTAEEAPAAGAEGAGTDGAGGAAGEGTEGLPASEAAGDPAGEAAGGEPAGDDERVPGRRRIEVEVGSLTEVKVPPDFVATVAEQALCQVQRMGQLAEIQVGYRRILIVLVTSGFLLLLGLMFYGIKMTHRVAGPLHKVTLYLDKMQNGIYDQVYNLRKGDQLVEFYEHFKGAHAGLVAMQKEDIARIEAILREAEKADLVGRSPEVAAAINELRAILERKEKSLG